MTHTISLRHLVLETTLDFIFSLARRFWLIRLSYECKRILYRDIRCYMNPPESSLPDVLLLLICTPETFQHHAFLLVKTSHECISAPFAGQLA